MSNWRTFKPTVSPESWKRIEQYIEDAREHTELSDYPEISSWYEMASVLSMHENKLAVDKQFKALTVDYELYWGSMAGIEWP